MPLSDDELKTLAEISENLADYVPLPNTTEAEKAEMADAMIDPTHLYEAIEELHYRWMLFANAKNQLDAADALVTLANAMHDVASYHPGWDIDTGTMPWEREDAER